MNIELLEMLSNDGSHYPHALERQFPRILEKIMAMWEKPEIDDYFTELLVSKRSDRRGFPPDVASDIMNLSIVYASLHAPAPVGSAWDKLPENFRNRVEMEGVSYSRQGLFQAVESGNSIAASLFISAGLDVDILDGRHWTPLMVSSFNGNEEMAELLINAGANVRHMDDSGYTSLHWAALNGYTEVVDLLLAKGAEVNARSAYGLTPLLQAVTRGYLTVSSMLLSKGADVNAVTDDGWTALHKAAANGYFQEVILLLSKGADVRARLADGRTAIDLAKSHKHQQIITVLIGKS